MNDQKYENKTVLLPDNDRDNEKEMEQMISILFNGLNHSK